MGADGGINWVRVTGDKDEFRRLVGPLGLFWHRSYYDEYHDDYIEKYDPVPKTKDGFYEISTYGTNQDVQGFDDLHDLIQELQWYKRPSRKPFDNVWGDTDPLDLTWIEMLTEYYTADYWKSENTWFLPIPMRLMIQRHDWIYDVNTGLIKEEYKHYDKPVFHITLREWLDRICKIIDLKSFGSIETWT